MPKKQRIALAILLIIGVSVFGYWSLIYSQAPSGTQETSANSEVVPTFDPNYVPVAVKIDSIRAESTLIPTGIDVNGKAEVPPVTKPLQASWFEFSSVPGQDGPSIILGHINGGGQPGIFTRLGEMKNDDLVTIKLSDGKLVSFKVYDKQQVDKDQFPTSKVYGETKDNRSEIRLITCGGVFDKGQPGGGSYTDNIIVFAYLVK